MKEAAVEYASEFEILLSNERAQAAEMVLGPGQSEGGPDNIHENSDQWLYVVAGEGRAIVNETEIGLVSGKLLLIEKGDRHEIRNTGSRPLRTLNIYVPPEY
jgi:mannose-6-phosphate isomerase-like protein (cupin superfamily)